MPITGSTPLRVAFDVGPLHGPLTGIGRAVAGMRAGLADHPDDVALTPYVLSYRAELSAGVTRLPYPAALAIRAWGARATRSFPRADRHLPGIDLVHGTNYVVPPSQRPRLVSVYDCWALDRPDSATPVVNRAMSALRRAVDDGAVIHASSNATADACRRHFGGCDIHVVHLGSPVPHPHPPLPVARLPIGGHTALAHGSPFVLSVGTLERRKNLAHLVASFAVAAARLPDVHLVIAGSDGDHAPAVRSAVDRLPPDVSSRVLLLGRVDDESLHWLYSHATVVAYPSLDEGFGFPVLEAMSYGVPVVASSVGSIPEVAGGAALLVGVDDGAALSDALVRSVTDSELRRNMVAAGREQVSHFTWSATTDRLIDLYRRVADAR